MLFVHRGSVGIEHLDIAGIVIAGNIGIVAFVERHLIDSIAGAVARIVKIERVARH